MVLPKSVREPLGLRPRGWPGGIPVRGLSAALLRTGATQGHARRGRDRSRRAHTLWRDAPVGEPLATAPLLPPPEEEYLQMLQVDVASNTGATCTLLPLADLSARQGPHSSGA